MAPPVTQSPASPAGWELAYRAPNPALRGYLHDYCGYREQTPQPLARRELPHGGITLAVNLGAPLLIERAPYASFVAGLHDAAVITEHQGSQYGIELRLTPIGGYTMFGTPMRELTNAVVDLGTLLGPGGDTLVDRLAGTPGWAARFALLDDYLMRRFANGPVASPEVVWAWRQLSRSGGALPVGALSAEIGWSHRHFVSRFREQIGLAPKALARVLRFRRALTLLGGAVPDPWARIAVECGYSDQAHLNREFRALAGRTPTALLAARLPGFGGIAA